MHEDFQKIAAKLLLLSKQFDTEELFPTLERGATEFIHNNPFAFVVAVCLDRGTKAEIIWTIPYWISKIVGHFDPVKFGILPLDKITAIFERLPKKPRYIDAAPRTFLDISMVVAKDFHSDATLIWKNKSASEVKDTFLRIYGVGEGIASMGVLLIEKAYGISFPDKYWMDIKPDVNTMRVLYRLGVSSAIEERAAINAARMLNPSFPGEIDGALWLIGRKWCKASNSDCSQCPMNVECPKVDL